WKPDFGMRFAALGVDFEMFGKDHQANAPIYDRICRVLGGNPPEHYVFELFLDQNGEKISKSKGNGLTIDEWLAYAPSESLALYMFQKPRTAKRLYFDVIPKAVDEYYAHCAAFSKQDAAGRLNNPAWHIHNGNPPTEPLPVSYAMLLNLVSASNAESKEVLWGFISRYAPGVTAETHPHIDALAGYALRYFEDFVLSQKTFATPDEVELAALAQLDVKLAGLAPGEQSDGAAIQNAVLAAAKSFDRYLDPNKKGPDGNPAVKSDWFNALYRTLLGQERGPRLGSFIALYGVDEMRALIGKATKGELAK
ncbi:MAG: lysine--tRNA ligase, partial [Pseudomonadota bacterium]